MDIERIAIFVLFLIFVKMLSALLGIWLMGQKKTSYICCPTWKLEWPQRAYESGLLGKFCVQRKGPFERPCTEELLNSQSCV